jgi:hypothetical protein
MGADEHIRERGGAGGGVAVRGKPTSTAVNSNAAATARKAVVRFMV